MYTLFLRTQDELAHDNLNSTLYSRFQVKPVVQLNTNRSLMSAANCYDSTLLIKNTDLVDQREYSLHVVNERGTQEGIVRLQVTSPLSTTVLIASGLSIIIIAFFVCIFMLMCIKRSRKGEEKVEPSATQAGNGVVHETMTKIDNAQSSSGINPIELVRSVQNRQSCDQEFLSVKAVPYHVDSMNAPDKEPKAKQRNHITGQSFN